MVAKLGFTEHQIQYRIASYLRYNNIFFIETDVMSGLQYFSPKDARRFGYIAHHNKMGYVKGQSDLILLLPKRVVFVELKTEIGRQSKEQKDFESKVRDLGFEYYIWRSLEDAINFIKDL